MKELKFTLADAEKASEEWGFNCGPSAVASILGLSIEEVRPHLGDFELKRYTNPTLMWSILRSLGQHWCMQEKTPGGLQWPNWGLARIQWEGPWTAEGVPMAARYRHTHWVGVNGRDRFDIGIWDINCLNNGSGWVSLEVWRMIVVPWIVKECHPRADGKWHITHAVEIRGE